MSQLGGNLGATNIDLPVLRFFRDELKATSLLDIGCGKAGVVFHSIHLGMHAVGIEGDPSSIPVDCPFVYQVDYRKSSSSLLQRFDIGYSCEFLEHVPEMYMDNYMKDFRKCRYILVTAAPPGWGGVGHVNEQAEPYWVKSFQKYGFEFLEEETALIRGISEITFAGNVRMDKKQFIRNRGLFFYNRDF